MEKHGLYTVKDSYFSEFKSAFWVDNKQEKRPYYYCLQDAQGINWLIPLSTQVKNYKAKILKEEKKRGLGNCVYYHIGVVGQKERAFLIGDMFPIADVYIQSSFTIDGVHYIVKNTKLNRSLYSKAMRFLNLVKDGKIKSRNNIMGIKQTILCGIQSP